MAEQADIVVFGTGNFAARILFDLAATAPSALRVGVAGRNRARLAWLRTAGAARAAMFGTGVRVADYFVDPLSTESAARLLADLRPRIVVNTASAQGGRAASERPDPWAKLVHEAGLGITALLQARISLDISRASAAAAPQAYFVNCCYPDVVNPMIAAARLPITSGIGNVAILEHAFAGALGPGREKIHLLAQHAALAAFRRPAEERVGKAPVRMWLGGREVTDVFERFASVKLAPEPVIDISGASGVPLFIAMVMQKPWFGHVPGPNGLSGGYPVRLEEGALKLDLPPGISSNEAIDWNAAFEGDNGVLVEPGGFVSYTGKVEEALGRVSPGVAAGFSMSDFDEAYLAMSALRSRLRAEG